MTTASIPNPLATGPEATLELLWRRIRERGNLPGLSRTLGFLTKTLQKPEDHNLNITRTVLADPALTQRVLRLANSAMYAVYGQSVNTVSRAVMVLGTESIGHLAFGMTLLDDFLALSGESAAAYREVENAVLAGHIAREVATTTFSREDEEAVVCAILHNLGRMMVTFYLPEKWAAVQEKKQHGAGDEKALAREILGMGLDEISRVVAEQWQLPRSIAATLAPVRGPVESVREDRCAWLSAVSEMSSECAGVLNAYPRDSERLAEVAGSYSSMLGLETAAICAAVRTASALADKEITLLQKRSVATLRQAAGKPAEERRRGATIEFLYHGVAEMSGAAPGSSTGQLLSIALETMHRGLGGQHTIAFLRQREHGRYTARMLLGDDPDGRLSALYFPDVFQADVFHAAAASDKIIFVANAQDAVFRTKLPEWWTKAMQDVSGFVILPLIVQRQPIGFLLATWGESDEAQPLGEIEIATLNEIRAIIVRSMERRL